MIPFESDNLKAYALLLRIEIALRELLRISLAAEFGVPWRKRLPGDLLKKIKESQTEANRPQLGCLRLASVLKIKNTLILKQTLKHSLNFHAHDYVGLLAR